MRRRTFLLGLGVLSVSGCMATDPRITGKPDPIPSPTPLAPLSGASALASLEGAVADLLAGMAASPWAAADAARFTLLAGIHRTHQAVLAAPDPLRREAVQVEGTTVTAPADRAQALAAATSVLTRLKQSHEALAAQTTGLAAAFWASQAASAVQTISALTLSVTAVTPTVPLRLVAATTPAAATDALLDRYHEAAYGLESCLGRLSSAHPWRAQLSAVATATKTQRDALVARARAASQTPAPGAAAYSVPATSSDDQALALAARLLAAITAAATVVVASVPTVTATAVADLETASTLGLSLGMGLAEYPGWPDT